MKFFITICAFVISSIVNAAPSDNDEVPWYQIEIIVFEYPDQEGKKSEIWPTDPGLPPFRDSIELIGHTEPATELELNLFKLDDSFSNTPIMLTEPESRIEFSELPEPYRLLPASEFNLIEEENKLTKSADYYPLLHITWRQPVLSKKDAIPVHIYSTMGQENARNTRDFSETQAILEHDDFFMFQFEDEKSLANTIDGTIRIVLGTYLHLEADLLYRGQPTSSGFFSRNDETSNNYRIKQASRMRSKKLYYFDHPLFGLIAMITPYELPKDEIRLLDENSMIDVSSDN